MMQRFQFSLILAISANPDKIVDLTYDTRWGFSSSAFVCSSVVLQFIFWWLAHHSSVSFWCFRNVVLSAAHGACATLRHRRSMSQRLWTTHPVVYRGVWVERVERKSVILLLSKSFGSRTTWLLRVPLWDAVGYRNETQERAPRQCAIDWTSENVRKRIAGAAKITRWRAV